MLVQLLHLFNLAPFAPADRDRLVGRGDGADRAGRALPRPRGAGAGGDEVYDEGLGLVPGAVLLPHARRRLRIDDPVRMGVLARRFAPARCVVLDDGVRLDLGPDGALPAGARVVDRGRSGRDAVTAATRRLAINRLRDRKPLDAAAVDRFLARHEVPVVEGERCTFLWRGEADEAWVTQRIVDLPDRLPMRRLRGTDLWFLVVELPEGSRVEYQIEIRRGEHYERFNDPLNPHRSHSPMGSSSVCFAAGYETPDWALPDPEARPGELVDFSMPSRALRRRLPGHASTCRPGSGPPAATRCWSCTTAATSCSTPPRRPCWTTSSTRLDVAEMVVAFIDPGDRLVEYADSAAHARFVTSELLPRLERELPLVARRSGRCLLGASFGAVAALSTATRARGDVRLAGAHVRLVRLHRHRQRPRRRPGLRPGRASSSTATGPGRAGSPTGCSSAAASTSR